MRCPPAQAQWQSVEDFWRACTGQAPQAAGPAPEAAGARGAEGLSAAAAAEEVRLPQCEHPVPPGPRVHSFGDRRHVEGRLSRRPSI